MTATSTVDSFIIKAKNRHGNKYGYSKVVYVRAIDKVIIECPIHGEFLQSPNAHLSGYGCKKCGINHLANVHQHDKEIFVKSARKVHGDHYNYNNAIYVKSSIKLEIGCPIHGPFWQTPNNHIRGKGCRKCGDEAIHLPFNDFLTRSISIHSNKYDYSQVEYTTTRDYINIGCPTHGTFNQQVMAHLRGNGCPDCSSLTRWLFIAKDRPAFLYIVKVVSRTNSEEVFYKVGVTVRNPKVRFSKFFGHTYTPIFTRLYLNPTQAFEEELRIKRLTESFRYYPTTSFGGSIEECFSLDFDITKLQPSEYTSSEVCDLIFKLKPDVEEVHIVNVNGRVTKIYVLLHKHTEPIEFDMNLLI